MESRFVARPFDGIVDVIFGNAELLNLAPDGFERFFFVLRVGIANRREHDLPALSTYIEVL